MKIAIIGGGYVGLHTALRLAITNDKWQIDVIDTDEIKVNKFNEGKSPIDDYYMDQFLKNNPYKLENIKYTTKAEDWKNYEMIFLALSTNPLKEKESRLNTNLIFSMVSEIRKNKDVSIVLRSTINLDDWKKLDEMNISYWPEFLSQGVETLKNLNQEVNVIKLSNYNSEELIFNELFKNKTLIKTSSKEAIATKIMHNTLDAYLITITNLFANISDENEINFHSIAPAIEMLLQKRTKVKKPGIGYGGSCYPKDSYSLINITSREEDKKLIEELNNFNISQSTIFLKFENIIRNSKNIIVLGSSFKGGTNDVTKTPTISLRKWLLKNNISYKIWEPMINEKWLLDGEVLSKDWMNDVSNSDLVIVASDWKEFNEVLLNYNGKVIDLKTTVENNGKMTLYQIGKPIND